MTFKEAYNDYSCIEKNDNIGDTIYHYTKSRDAVINICNGCLWATYIMDFPKCQNGDVNEGYLILRELLKLIPEIDEQRESDVASLIGTNELMDRFINRHETYVVSLTPNGNSKRMKENYWGDVGYTIVFDKEKFIDSLYIITKTGNKRDENNIFKHSMIIYNNKEQQDIIAEEYWKMMDNRDTCVTELVNVEDALEHLMYVGNFFKTTIYTDEEEYRLLVNTMAHGDDNINNMLPVVKTNKHGNGDKHYIEIYFDKSSIKKVYCKGVESKKAIDHDVTEIDLDILDDKV